MSPKLYHSCYFWYGTKVIQWNAVSLNRLFFTYRKAFSHTSHVPIFTASHRDQEPQGQPVGQQVAAGVATGPGQEEETQWCHGQTWGGTSFKPLLAYEKCPGMFQYSIHVMYKVLCILKECFAIISNVNSAFLQFYLWARINKLKNNHVNDFICFMETFRNYILEMLKIIWQAITKVLRQ